MTSLEIIDSRQAEIDRLEKELQIEMQFLQSQCEHPEETLRECDYKKLNYGSMPPIRVCTICGYGEEGWGCGYKKLDSTQPVPIIPRDFLKQKYLRHLVCQKRDTDND